MGQKNRDKGIGKEKMCHNSVGERGRGKGREDPAHTEQSQGPDTWDLLQL